MLVFEMKREWQRDVNITALSEKWLHAHSIFTSLLGLPPSSLGRILCISVCCVFLC